MRKQNFLMLLLVLVAAAPVVAKQVVAQQGSLKYTTGWLGNSFGGGPKWVQNFNEQMTVTPDGTVYVPSFWDEAGRDVGIYKNGDVIGKFDNTHMRGGFGLAVGGGYAYYTHTAPREDAKEVKAGEAPSEKPMCYFGVSRYTLDGKIVPFEGGKTPFKNMLSFREAPDNHDLVPQAAVTDGKTLYVADSAQNRVLVIATATMKILRTISVPRPNRLALSPKGELWILSGGGFGAEVYLYNAPAPIVFRVGAGDRITRIDLPLPPGTKASSLTFVSEHRLLVTDRGPNCQVYLVDTAIQPRLVETIGVKGGIYAGPVPGDVGPLRFPPLTGAGFDAKGRLYISAAPPRGGTVLRAFERQGTTWKMLWELYNTEFVDVADGDPVSDGKVAYTADGKYARSASGSWSWTAQTLDPFRYPDDMRQHLTGLQCGTQVRRLEGKTFIALRGMWQGILGIYRMDGDIAVPAAALCSGPVKAERSGWKPAGQPEKGRFLWRDANGNGQMDAGEYTATEGPEGEYWASNMDSHGDLWQGGGDTGIWRWRFEGLDKNGVPKYATKPDHEPMPAPFSDLLRTDYQPETDVMYLTGQTKDREITGGEWGTAGTVVCRYDNWSRPTRKLRYRTDVPYEAGKTFMVSFAVAGELFAVVDCKSAQVFVYDNRDGKPLGSLKPGAEVHGESGWIDFRDALRLTRLRSGDYQIFVEEDFKGKCLVYHLTDPQRHFLNLTSVSVRSNAQTLPGTLTYSWVGNSFMDHNTKAWVPDEVRDLCVDSHGTVFTAGYAEAGGSGLAIKNGAFFGRYSGFNSGFGDPVKAVATDGTNVYWGGGNGVQRYGYASGSASNLTVLKGSSITGLTSKEGKLYISDYSKNLIRVYTTNTMTQIRQWPCARPGKIAVDQNNRVWVIQYQPGSDPNTNLIGTQILSFSDTGAAGPSIVDVTNPLAITVNGSNQLLAGGLDEASQVRIYGNLSGKPVLVKTFGAKGGIFSGTPGLHAPLKFHQIRGLGVDGAGNIYVCMMYGAKAWGQSVEAYTSSGKLLWEVHGLDYVECAAMDPESETDAYDHQHHFKLDYTKSEGKEWRFQGFTVDRFKYPNDPRVTFEGGFRAGAAAFRVSGKMFIAETDQGSYPLTIYRFHSATDGEVAIPSVHFSGANPDNISRDANGNGRFDAEEMVAGAPGYYQYFDITADGGICRIGDAQGPAKITFYPCQGLDRVGNPIYTAASSTTWNAPPEFGSIRKVVYDNAHNLMYIGGQMTGSSEDAVVRLCRYDDWTGGRTKSWDVTIPYEDKNYTPETSYGAGRALSVRQAGQYVFIQYGYGYIRVHDKDSGVYLGTIKPTLHGFSGAGGQVDITQGMTAYKRANGEYILFTEDAGHNHIVMTRWNPIGTSSPPK